MAQTGSCCEKRPKTIHSPSSECEPNRSSRRTSGIGLLVDQNQVRFDMAVPVSTLDLPLFDVPQCVDKKDVIANGA